MAGQDGCPYKKSMQTISEPIAVETNSLMALGFYCYFSHAVKESELERTFLNSLPNKLSVFKQLRYEMEISCYDQTIWLI